LIAAIYIAVVSQMLPLFSKQALVVEEGLDPAALALASGT
jgi:hypothetical protein